ncbi:MAG: 5-(carboxyamino)imidazole ribonucleotide mutase [Alphaproteobacteria bacterium]|nr:5-(carboxyamino)imidazole ribonucleotide mutase [Alphaproteobacteria bacterium]
MENNNNPGNSENPYVFVAMGSDSDLPVMSAAVKLLDDLKIPRRLMILSAHRTPDKLFELAEWAEKQESLCAAVLGAGGAAHLPGMFASKVTLPVIGVPIKTSTLSGVDSVWSILQMPPGIPVATMAINGSRNAGILAAQIVSQRYPGFREKLRDHKQKLVDSVDEKNESLKELDYAEYLARELHLNKTQ